MKKYIHLITLTLLYACCKDKPVEVLPEQNLTTIDLTFTDNFSHEPVKDLTLNLYECDVDNLNNLINKVYLGTYNTDANGKFYIELKDLNKNPFKQFEARDVLNGKYRSSHESTISKSSRSTKCGYFTIKSSTNKLIAA